MALGYALRRFCVITEKVPICRRIEGKYFPLFDLVGVTKVNNRLCKLVTNLFILEPNTKYMGYLPSICIAFGITTTNTEILFDFPDISIDPKYSYIGMIITDMNSDNVSACFVYIFERKNIEVFSFNKPKFINYLGIKKYGIVRHIADLVELPYFYSNGYYRFENRYIPNIGLIDAEYRCYMPLLLNKFISMIVENNKMKITSLLQFDRIIKNIGIIITDIFDNIVIACECKLIERDVDDNITEDE